MLFGRQKSRNPDEQKDIILQVFGQGESVHYSLSSYSTQKVLWVSPETDTEGKPLVVRTPQERTQTYLKGQSFQAAGKTYSHWQQLCVSKEPGCMQKDVHGRDVLCVQERFPCFDSYDYLYEDRYYRWFFIRIGNRLTRVFCTDDKNEIFVTEDVENLETRCVKALREAGMLL